MTVRPAATSAAGTPPAPARPAYPINRYIETRAGLNTASASTPFTASDAVNVMRTSRRPAAHGAAAASSFAANTPPPPAFATECVKWFTSSPTRTVSRGGSRPPISAAAVATLYASGRYDSAMTVKCLDYVLRTVTPNGRETYGHWFYAHLYMSQAMYQVHDKRWDKYFVALRDRLLGTQNADGSWNGDGVGPVYGTAIACIALQLPYDYVPIFQR